ncbi:MAG: Asp-tRNA(Asn)/Glu-tRNA(Gln) amidotransferase subunit GatC [Vicinamibacterales bacterium]
MASKLDREEVRRIAALAHLSLTDAETERFAAELTAILGYAEAVRQVDTAGVSPTSHPLGLAGAWREDEPVPSLDRAAVLAGAPDADAGAGLFRVPRVVPGSE